MIRFNSWTEEQNEYLRKYYPTTLDTQKLTNEFNKIYKQHRTSHSIVTQATQVLALKKNIHNIKRKYTPEILQYIKDNIYNYRCMNDFCEVLNKKYNLTANRDSLQKVLKKMGIKKGHCKTHKQPSKFELEHLCITRYKNGGIHVRVKVENGYVGAPKYFIDKYFNGQKGKLIHLNGDYADFTRDNLELVDYAIYSSLHSRKWVFSDKEMTKTAILCCKLLAFFPEYTHDENAYLRKRR